MRIERIGDVLNGPPLEIEDLPYHIDEPDQVAVARLVGRSLGAVLWMSRRDVTELQAASGSEGLCVDELTIDVAMRSRAGSWQSVFCADSNVTILPTRVSDGPYTFGFMATVRGWTLHTGLRRPGDHVVAVDKQLLPLPPMGDTPLGLFVVAMPRG